MKKYAVNGLSSSGTGPNTATSVIGSASIRGLLSEFTVGVRTAPNATDQQVNYAIGPTTTTGTSTAATPKPLDLADPVAAVATAGITHTVEPTYAATYWFNSDINQRGAYRWVAEVGFEMGGLASANNCVAGKNIASTSALQMSLVFHYKE